MTHARDRNELIARAIAPDAWREFDDGNGVMSNQAFYQINDSWSAAARVQMALEAAGMLKEPT